MAYISILGEHFFKLPKKEFLMDYISRSCDPQKAKNGDWLYKQVMWLSKKGNLMDDISRSCDLPKKEIFDGLHKHFGEAFSGKFPKKEIW